MYGSTWMGWHGFFMPWGFIFFIVIILFIFLMRGNSCHSSSISKEDEALEIARKRFAKGEIDEETFEKIKEKLR